MSDVTEADREKAWLVLCALPISIPNYSPETVRKANEHLAAALAEEREKARAPFLAVATELDERGQIEVAAMEAEDDPVTASRYEGRAAAYARSAFRIRHAAGEV